jgi:fatty-acid desaturase
VGRRGEALRPASRHVQHQLDLPRLRRRRFRTSEESRNVFWLALPSFGESWHNNHHAFPTSACHGLDRWQLVPFALVIRGLEACGA